MKNIAEQLDLWSARLRDISAYGLTFCRNPYDLENYHKIQQVALEMTAALTGQEVEDLEPIRKTIIGRPTPLLVVDAAILNDREEVLLIRRTDNGEWAFPGGYQDIGETAAETVVREVCEEVGIQVEPVCLVGIYDARRLRNAPLNQVSTILFLCRPAAGVKLDFDNRAEVLEKKWCSETDLAALDLDPYIRLRAGQAFQSTHPGFQPYFDLQRG